jgi:hypothetical protein
MRKLIALAKSFDSWPVELLLALVAILWGSWWLLPGTTASQQPMFAFLMHLAPQTLWAYGLLAIGLFQIIALRLRRRAMRRVACVAATGWWVGMATAFALGDWRAAGVPILTLYAAAECCAALRD